jgi:uncharacterized protein YggE
MNNRRVWLIGLAVIVSVVFGMWVFSPTEVVVTGVGRVSVPATSATFNVTLTSVKDTANEALSDLRSKMGAIKQTLSDINITAENVTETQIILVPASTIVASAKGFQAMATLNVTTANVALAPEMVVNMYAGGATIVSQPVVKVENQEKLEKEAMDFALKQARNSLKETIGFRPIRKIVGIQQASSGNVATSTKTAEDKNGEFEVIRAVSVTYRVW